MTGKHQIIYYMNQGSYLPTVLIVISPPYLNNPSELGLFYHPHIPDPLKMAKKCPPDKKPTMCGNWKFVSSNVTIKITFTNLFHNILGSNRSSFMTCCINVLATGVLEIRTIQQCKSFKI